MYTIILYTFRFEFLNIKLENTKEEKYQRKYVAV